MNYPHSAVHSLWVPLGCVRCRTGTDRRPLESPNSPLCRSNAAKQPSAPCRTWFRSWGRQARVVCRCPLQELFQTLGRASESELEHIVPMLAKKAGEVSNAGRDTFLAADADRTLAVLVECCSEGRVAAALLGCVAHKSPQTRAKVAAHLDSVAQGEHGQRLAGEGSWVGLHRQC